VSDERIREPGGQFRSRPLPLRPRRSHALLPCRGFGR
jgi:hypothetical protein